MATLMQIPKHILKEMLEVSRRFSIAEDELEDFLLASNPDFIKKMRRLRASHKRETLGDWRKLKTKYGL